LSTVEDKQTTYRITVNVKGIVLYDKATSEKCGRQNLDDEFCGTF